MFITLAPTHIMTLSKQFLLFIIFFPLLNASTPKSCHTSSCRRGNVHVRFPFWLISNQPESCGHIDFNLLCTDTHETSLKLPNSETFLVRQIDYINQRIRLKDPQNCVARELLRFNTLGSPFSLYEPRNLTFLVCPKVENITSSLFKPIPCLGNSTSSFFAFSQLWFSSLVPTRCQILKTVVVPYIDLDNQDLWLQWNSPDCRHCERAVLRCGFRNSTSDQVKCFGGDYNTAFQVLKIICLSLVGPLIALTFCISLIMCSSGRVSSQLRQAAAARLAGAVTPQPSDIELVTSTGLDESTIETYKKVELGESRRLPAGPNDNVCPICLSEYATKETVRCLPECEHCFHSDCIDVWLKLHNSCPVCRSNPSPVHQTGSYESD